MASLLCNKQTEKGKSEAELEETAEQLVSFYTPECEPPMCHRETMPRMLSWIRMKDYRLSYCRRQLITWLRVYCMGGPVNNLNALSLWGTRPWVMTGKCSSPFVLGPWLLVRASMLMRAKATGLQWGMFRLPQWKWLTPACRLIVRFYKLKGVHWLRITHLCENLIYSMSEDIINTCHNSNFTNR